MKFLDEEEEEDVDKAVDEREENPDEEDYIEKKLEEEKKVFGRVRKTEDTLEGLVFSFAGTLSNCLSLKGEGGGFAFS
jgi:hypothetical protein